MTSPYEQGGSGYIPEHAGPPETGPEIPAPSVPAGYVPVDALAAIVDQAVKRALDQQKASFDERFDALTSELESTRKTAKAQTGEIGFVPEHGGGPGVEIAETWSWYDQQLAIKGEHPSQLAANKQAETDQQRLYDSKAAATQ